MRVTKTNKWIRRNKYPLRTGLTIEELTGIRADLYELRKLPDEVSKEALFEVGKTLMHAVQDALPRSDKEYDSKNGRRKKHVHLKDDVKYWVDHAKGSGPLYVSIYGGYDTGYKWGWINDGYIHAKSHEFVPGIHFLEKAIVRSQSTIESIIDDYLEEGLKDE